MRPARSRRWWRRWRSGAYDRAAVIRAALVEKLRGYMAEAPAYFGPDLAELEATGRLMSPARSTLDAFFALAQDYRLSERGIRRCLRALGMHESPLVDPHWGGPETPAGA